MLIIHTIFAPTFVGALHTTEMPPQTGKKGAYLYEKVKENPILQTQNVDVEEFYVDKSETNIGDFSEIKDGIKSIYASSQDSLINTLQTNVKGLLLQIYANDSLLASATNANDSASITSANIPLQDSINVLQAQIQTISQSLQTEKHNKADSLVVSNSEITTTRQMEDNERTVNDIYLKTVAKAVYHLDSIQIADLENIIYQCPLAGGSAVFKARSLYTLHTMQLWYNDDSLCNLVNMQWRHAQQNIPIIEGVQVYPNPTTGDITFDFTTVSIENANVYIYDLRGKLILRKHIDTDSHTVNLSLGTYSSGMYLYKVVSGDKSYTGKIILE